MRVFKSEAALGGRDSTGFRIAAGVADRGSYRLHAASDMTWQGGAYYGHRSFGQKLGSALLAVARIVIPVLALLAGIAAIYLYRDTPLPLFVDGVGVPWLTASDLIIPAAFFAVFLTNRRYGPAYAFAQVIIASIAVTVLAIFARDLVLDAFPPETVPPMREAAAFGAAFFVAAFVSIIAFDGARGAYWWTAPLFGFLAAAIVYPLVFFPVRYMGTDTAWLTHALEYMGLMAGEGVLLLIPFWLMRRAVPPMSGFGGY